MKNIDYKLERVMKYKIEISKANKIMFILGILLSIIMAIMILIVDADLLFKTIYAIFFTLISLMFILIFTFYIKITANYIFICSGMFCHKTIRLSNIKEVRVVNDKDIIVKGNPAYSKNVIAIEYENDKTIFVSIALKEKYEFIKKLHDAITRERV